MCWCNVLSKALCFFVCQTLAKKKRELDICLDYKQYYIYCLFMSLLNNFEFSIHVKGILSSNMNLFEQHQF